MNLEERAELLRSEALDIIEKLNLNDALGTIGEMKIIGSVALNLMTWRDIDIHVHTYEKPTRDDLVKVANQVYGNQNVRKITCIDYDNHRLSKNIANKPIGQYLGVEYIDEKENQWKIDLWLLEKSDVKNTEFAVENISPETRRSILEIKNQYHSHPLYRNKITSVDIYEAVINHNVKSADDFNAYLKGKGVL